MFLKSLEMASDPCYSHINNHLVKYLKKSEETSKDGEFSSSPIYP